MKTLKKIDDLYCNIYYSNNKKHLEKIYTNKKDSHHISQIELCSSYAGVCISENRNVYIFVFDNKINTLVHELFHSMLRVNNNIGSVICEDNEEFNAYYMQSLFQKILDLDKGLEK